jgi:hypothetical protein
VRVAVLADIHGNLPALEAVLRDAEAAAYFDWCAARISRAQRDRLASLPLTVTLDIGGLGPPDAAIGDVHPRCGGELCALASVNMSGSREPSQSSHDGFVRAVVTSPPIGG